MNKHTSTTTATPVSVSYSETFVHISSFGRTGPLSLGFVEITEKVSDRDPKKILGKTDGIISFEFFDRIVKDGKTEEVNRSAFYIPGGKVFTRKEIQNDPERVDILEDMKKGNWEKVLVTDFMYQKYEEGKFIVI